MNLMQFHAVLRNKTIDHFLLKRMSNNKKKVGVNDLFSMVTFLRLFPLNPFVLEAFQIEGAGRAPNESIERCC